MGWRTVILSKEAKISLRMNHLVVMSDVKQTVPLDEIESIIIENPSISLTGHVINALSDAKIHIILCNHKHLPTTNIQSIYGHHRQSKHIQQQITWQMEHKQLLWKIIVEEKLKNQAKLLKHYRMEGYEDVFSLARNVQLGDTTNREGHGAKIYFHRLFGQHFIRGYDDALNARLNYGYALIHSLVARLVVSKGYLTEVGIFHKNEYNQFNLASDLMEVLRPLVDSIAYECQDDVFTKEDRRAFIQAFEQKLSIRGRNYYFSQAVQIYVESCLEYLHTGDVGKIQMPSLTFEKVRGV